MCSWLIPEEQPFLWLQSVDQPALAFIVAPHEAVAAAAPKLTPAQHDELGLGCGEAPEVYVIVSPGADPRLATMNLLAPLYVCRRTGRARQVVTAADVALAHAPLP